MLATLQYNEPSLALTVYPSCTKNSCKMINDKESRIKTGKGFEQAIHRRDASGHNRSDIDFD